MSKSSTTKSRRNAKGTPKAQTPAKAKAKTPRVDASQPNKVIQRRLAFLTDANRRKAAAAFAAGTSISNLVNEFGLTATKIAYCVRQELVEQGKVNRIPATKAAIKDAHGQENGDWAWIACRTGLSTQAAQKLVQD